MLMTLAKRQGVIHPNQDWSGVDEAASGGTRCLSDALQSGLPEHAMQTGMQTQRSNVLTFYKC